MASTTKQGKTTKQLENPAANVPLTTSFTKDIFSRMVKYKIAKGLLTEAEVIRQAVSLLLDKSGF